MLVLQLCPRPVIICVMCHQTMLLQMFPLPQQSYSDERLMEMVGRKRGSSGQSESAN